MKLPWRRKTAVAACFRPETLEEAQRILADLQPHFPSARLENGAVYINEMWPVSQAKEFGRAIKALSQSWPYPEATGTLDVTIGEDPHGPSQQSAVE